jgi:hypothetical protein
MNDEFDTLGGCHANFESSASFVGAYEHDEVVQVEDSDGVAISMEHVGDPVFAGAGQDDRVRVVNLP